LTLSRVPPAGSPYPAGIFFPQDEIFCVLAETVGRKVIVFGGVLWYAIRVEE
jgi:hypothetical protein